jgi:hypothetical protein
MKTQMERKLKHGYQFFCVNVHKLQELQKFITLFDMDGEVKFSRSFFDRFSNDIHKLLKEHGVHHTIDLLSKSALVS